MGFWPAVEKDPFRLFFPLGALLGLLGAGPWVLLLFGVEYYPRDFHRVLMVDGFLLSFVCGFLMTAIPRFTGTAFAARFEVLGVLASILAAAAGAFFAQWLSFGGSGAAIIFTMAFAARRFAKKTSNPPYTFIFIGVGLFLWLAGSLGQLAVAVGLPFPAEIAQDLFTNGAIMSLILGVGGRLIPGILGWEEIVVAQRKRYETSEPFLRLIPPDVWAAMLAFLASYVLLPWLAPAICWITRGLVTLYFGIVYWRVHRFPKTRTYMTWSLWASAWCLIAGYFLPVLWPAGGVHAFHLLFIGGFSLLTLLISLRVSFAHGAAGTGVEKHTRGILVLTLVILLAAATRVTSILRPDMYLRHLGYASIVWCAGLLLWAWTRHRPRAGQ